MQHESLQQEAVTRCKTRRGARRGNHAASRERASVFPSHAQQPSYNAMPAYMLPQTTMYCAQSVTQPHAWTVSSPYMATGGYGEAGGSGMTAAATAAGVFVPPECATPATSAMPPMSRRAARAAVRAAAVRAAATSATAATRTSTDAATTSAAAVRPTQSSVDPNNARTWRDVDFHALLRAFALDDGATTLTLPASLTPAQRSFVHRTAAAFKLLHKSAGTGSERALTLTKAVAPARGPHVGSSSCSSSGSAVAAAAAVRRGDEDHAHNDATAANATAPRTMSGADVGAVAETMAPDVATMSDGERVKTFSGYQGAQLLPCTHLDDATVGQLLRTLQPLHRRMRRGIVVEAHRAPTASPYHAAALGLAQPPGPSSSTLTAARVSQLQRFRRALPAYNARERIMDAVRQSDVVVVSGATGCGKTTQVPQMLYDAGLFAPDAVVLCTQPRRISAMTVAQRVADERGEACGDSCGYTIRFENVTSARTRIVYVTTGILLRRLHYDPDLHGVACVVVDEVHERDVETDLCLLLLRDRLLRQQQHQQQQLLSGQQTMASTTLLPRLSLVIMSATVQIDTLVRYFDDVAHGTGVPVPVIYIPGSLFPVTTLYLEEALRVTGVSASSVPAAALMTRRATATASAAAVVTDDGCASTAASLCASLPAADAEASSTSSSEALYDRLRARVFSAAAQDAELMVPYELIVRLILFVHTTNDNLTGGILVFLPGWGAIQGIATRLRQSPRAAELSVLLLHSSLTTAEQQRVFAPAPRRYRKVVLATNIAETSITIDDIVYVIDSALHKDNVYDAASNTSALRAAFIGKANGLQRRGRAGRVRPGVCYHLLPESAYAALPDFVPPALLRSPLEEVCLQVKAVHSRERCGAVLARALDAPPAASVAHAVAFLTDMGVFTQDEEQLTPLGRALAQLPVHPQLGKMLFAAACVGVLEPIATIAAGLSVKSVFVKPQPHQRTAARACWLHVDDNALSDHLMLLRVYDAWLRSGRSARCASEYFADPAALRALERTRRQLLHLVLRSPLVRHMRNKEHDTSRHADNDGLVRLVLLWSLYPRVATIEYRRWRNTNAPQVVCWDDKHASFAASSLLASCRRRELGERTWVMYYERMYLEALLSLFDASCVSALDVVLCVRALVVLPLLRVPPHLLRDVHCTVVPPTAVDTTSVTEHGAGYDALLLDGDKKLYVAPHATARAVRMMRECFDYYLAVCIKHLRADLLPRELVAALAMLIGYPLTSSSSSTLTIRRPSMSLYTDPCATTGAATHAHEAAYNDTGACDAVVTPPHHRPAWSSSRSEEVDGDGDGDVYMEELNVQDDDYDADGGGGRKEANVELHLSAAQEQQARAALGDLAVLRDGKARAWLVSEAAAATQPPPPLPPQQQQQLVQSTDDAAHMPAQTHAAHVTPHAAAAALAVSATLCGNDDDDDDDDEDEVVAAVGALRLR